MPRYRKVIEKHGKLWLRQRFHPEPVPYGRERARRIKRNLPRTMKRLKQR